MNSLVRSCRCSSTQKVNEELDSDRLPRRLPAGKIASRERERERETFVFASLGAVKLSVCLLARCLRSASGGPSVHVWLLPFPFRFRSAFAAGGRHLHPASSGRRDNNKWKRSIDIAHESPVRSLVRPLMACFCECLSCNSQAKLDRDHNDDKAASSNCGAT